MLARELADAGFALVEQRFFNRAAVPGWWWNGRILKRRSFSRVQLKLFDLAVPVLRLVDRLLPWNGLGLVAIARRVEEATPATAAAPAP